MKLSIKETADLVTFFEQIPNGKCHFCVVIAYVTNTKTMNNDNNQYTILNKTIYHNRNLREKNKKFLKFQMFSHTLK